MSTMIFHQLRSVYRSTNLSISTWPFLSLICRCWAAEFMIPAASEGFTQLPNVQIAALTRFLVKSCFQIVDEPRLTVKVDGHRNSQVGIEMYNWTIPSNPKPPFKYIFPMRIPSALPLALAWFIFDAMEPVCIVDQHEHVRLQLNLFDKPVKLNVWNSNSIPYIDSPRIGLSWAILDYLGLSFVRI